MKYQEAAKMEDEVGGQEKRGQEKQRLFFSLPFAFLLPLFLFQLPFLLLFLDREQDG